MRSMCEFCNELRKEGYATLASVTNDLGILNEMKTSIMCFDDEEGSFILQSALGGILGTAKEATVKINYCPICGRKLV